MFFFYTPTEFLKIKVLLVQLEIFEAKAPRMAEQGENAFHKCVLDLNLQHSRVDIRK